MNFVQLNRITNSKTGPSQDSLTIALGCAALFVMFLIAISLASMSPGTALADLASQTVLP